MLKSHCSCLKTISVLETEEMYALAVRKVDRLRDAVGPPFRSGYGTIPIVENPLGNGFHRIPNARGNCPRLLAEQE
jgi:hypothetical protein